MKIAGQITFSGFCSIPVYNIHIIWRTEQNKKKNLVKNQVLFLQGPPIKRSLRCPERYRGPKHHKGFISDGIFCLSSIVIQSYDVSTQVRSPPSSWPVSTSMSQGIAGAWMFAQWRRPFSTFPLNVLIWLFFFFFLLTK